MKLYFGKYRTCSVYHALDPLFDLFCVHEIDRLKISDKIQSSFFGKLFLKFCTKFNKFNYIKIDPWDTWSVDETLSIITLPLLKQLKATKHGSGFIDDNDVPEHLRSYNAPPKENEWDTDEFFHARYDWFLDEIIWTFEQLQPDNFWEDQYRTRKSNLEFTDGKVTMIDGHCDWDKVKEHQSRINNGLRLFGVYYNTLWD